LQEAYNNSYNYTPDLANSPWSWARAA